MKNQLFLLLLLFPCLLRSQENCQGSFTEYYLNSNNIRASFFPRGNKFTDGKRGGFLVPYPSQERLSTIFASSVWIGGFDDAGNYKHSTERFPRLNDVDFNVGPLTHIGTPYDTLCEKFDRVWSVFAEDILKHKKFFDLGIKITDTIPSVFGWPARGNKYFARFNGFELPPEDTYGLADFYDRNGNHVYEPDLGDYPVVKLLYGYNFIPDQMLWMVFNDANSSGNYPLRFEIQLTAFAFHCLDNTFLNNTIFNKYKIINRAVTSADSVFFGLWTDYDLGCPEDDFMGSDSARSTEFVYNADPNDGINGQDCDGEGNSFGLNPPIQSMTWLSHPMHSFIEDAHSNGHLLENYRLLNGMWADGNPLRPEGDGYTTTSGLSPTKFLFNGDPRDTASWSAINVLETNWDHRSVSSVFLDRLDPGQFTFVMTANMYHRNPNEDYSGQITQMYNNVDSLLSLISLLYLFDEPCMAQPVCTDDDCVWPGDFDNNGIADHRDYLMWGVMNESTGPERNGQISWRGHPGESWDNSYVDINAKHGDGDGNGKVDSEDIQVNNLNFTLTNRYYDAKPNYPKGPEIVLSAKPFFNDQGSIEKVNVSAGQELHNVLGLAFEIEFDTALFYVPGSFFLQDNDTSRLYYLEDIEHKTSVRYSFVKKDHLAITINAGWSFFVPINNMSRLKPGQQVPDSTIIRLRNLKAIDAEGNDLHIGSEPIVIHKAGIVGIHDPSDAKTLVYPNPSNGFLHIETAIESEAQIFSLQGQMIRHLPANELKSPIDISSLVPGMYILRILATGESIKVIVQ